MENSSNNTADKIIDGRAIAAKLFAEIYNQAVYLPFKPILCDVIVGTDPVSLSYVNIKGKKAKECGFDFSVVQLPTDSTEEEVIAAIEEKQVEKNLCGLIVQLPLPAQLDSERILKSISRTVDVDGLNPETASALVPPTAGAIMYILASLEIDLSAEKFVVLGQGDLVGKPVTEVLLAEGFKVETVLADTPNRAEILKSATIIISGVGKAGVLTGEDVSENVIVIDAGTSESGGSIAGDVDFASVAPKARLITPSPGGVGPVTVAKLLENVLKVAQSKL
jgi:methylenetetrahydrofolate dehydrogenase (NADP+) / methenyltetrahydrofolate cyclohydrolase